MTVYFASNRDVIHETSKDCKNLGKRFNADGPQFFRVGRAGATLAGDPFDDDAWAPGRCELFPEKLDTGRSSNIRIGSPRFFEEVSQLLGQSGADVIIFIHGFASTFSSSMVRAVSLQAVYGNRWTANQQRWNIEGREPPVVVAFSWPSNGNVFPAYEYFSDREDAQASGLAMARALDKFFQFLLELRQKDRALIRERANTGTVPTADEMAQCQRKIHVLAHSMGNWALRHAVLKYTQLVGRRPLPRLFDNAFLIAADEDADALGDEGKLALITDLANAVHVYHSRNDRALQISDTTKGKPDRLGSDGPRNFADLNERIIAIDCHLVDDTTLAHGNHQYYRLRSEVIDDILMSVAGLPHDNRPGRDTLMPGRAWRIRTQ